MVLLDIRLGAPVRPLARGNDAPMITLRRNEERHHRQSDEQEAWLTFNPQDRTDPLADGFLTLEILDEYRLAPGTSIPHHPHRDAEIVTYVREGALLYEDSMGHSRIIYAGEFQRETAGLDIRLRQTNASRTACAHVFQIWLRSAELELEPNHEQQRFSAAERRGLLCVVASPDARKDSLHLYQDVLVHSALLDPGQHIVHQLLQGHSAWLHLVEGEVTLGDIVLTMGDGAGIKAEHAISFTAWEKTEVLLIDFGNQSSARV